MPFCVHLGFFYSGEARLTGQDVLVSVLALVFGSLALMTVKQVLGFLFLQALRAEERIVMARPQCMTGEVGTRRHSGGSDDTRACCGGEVKTKPRLEKSEVCALTVFSDSLSQP